MRIVLFGASGMIGAGVLIECLDDPRVGEVLAIGRSPCGREHTKLREIIRSEFFDYTDVREELTGFDACFFCLGVSSAGMSEAKYRRLTFDLTIAAAETLERSNPGMAFCYVSGEGTDGSEAGRVMWARIKGMTENRLLAMDLDTYCFRPGFVQPMKGVRSKTALYQTFYTALAPFFPVLRRLLGRHMTTTVNIGRAMVEVAAHGHPERILGNHDIDRVAAGSGV